MYLSVKASAQALYISNSIVLHMKKYNILLSTLKTSFVFNIYSICPPYLCHQLDYFRQIEPPNAFIITNSNNNSGKMTPFFNNLTAWCSPGVPHSFQTWTRRSLRTYSSRGSKASNDLSRQMYHYQVCPCFIGLNSFSWESDVCTAYLAWRPQQRADCRDGGTKVVYVVKTPLKPFEGGSELLMIEKAYW